MKPESGQDVGPERERFTLTRGQREKANAAFVFVIVSGLTDAELAAMPTFPSWETEDESDDDGEVEVITCVICGVDVAPGKLYCDACGD